MVGHGPFFLIIVGTTFGLTATVTTVTTAAAEPATIPPAAAATAPTDPPTPYGFLYAPAYDLTVALRFPARVYQPQAGDVLLMSDTDWFWTLLYRLAGTGAPGHTGLVVPMPDGRLGVLEAGYAETFWTRLTPLERRLREYPGLVWVRRRATPLTPQQQEQLMEFAVAAADRRYAAIRVALQATPLRTRGPLRTFVLGRPHGPGRRYQCAQAVVEALVYAGAIDRRTARPSATYPQDLFYDRSWNLYIDRHPPLAGGWEPPALWTPTLGVALKGRTRAALGLPEGVLDGLDQLPDQPHALPQGIVERPPLLLQRPTGELQPVPRLEQPRQRLGLLDRPPLRPFHRR